MLPGTALVARPTAIRPGPGRQHKKPAPQTREDLLKPLDEKRHSIGRSWRGDVVAGLVAQMGTFCIPAGASADLKFDDELPGCVAAMYASFAMPPDLPKWTAARPLPGLHFMTPTRGDCAIGVGMGWCQKRRN